MLKTVAVLATALMIIIPAFSAHADEKPKSAKDANTPTHKTAGQMTGHAGKTSKPNAGSAKGLKITKTNDSASPQTLDASWRAESFKKVNPPAPPPK
jgi:hypothetical protein